MQYESNTEALRIAEHIKLRTLALSGASVAIAAAARTGSISSDEILQLLDVIAEDIRRNAEDLVGYLIDKAA